MKFRWFFVSAAIAVSVGLAIAQPVQKFYLQLSPTPSFLANGGPGLVQIAADGQPFIGPASSPLFNVKPLTRGDTITLQSCTSTTSPNAINCPGAAFTSSDVGKILAAHGTGAAGVAQIGTIASVSSSATIVPSFTIATAASVSINYGTDDTTGFANALAAAVAAKACLYVPLGAYWLASQSVAMPFNDACIIGEGSPPNAGPFTFGGSVLLIGNKTTSVFSGMSNARLEKMTVYYPEQDNSQATPVVFPPLFESAQFVNDRFIGNRILNAYRLLEVDASANTSGLGRVFFSDNRIYCIDRCFWFLNGAADTLQIDGTNYFGPGAYGNTATGGSAMLATYSQASGEWMRIDLGSATYQNVDGLDLTGFLVQGIRYGIRLSPSGGNSLLDVSTITGVNWDQVASFISAEGASQVDASVSITGGQIYSKNVYVPTQADNVININTTSQNFSPSITGLTVAYAQGSVIFDAGTGIGRLSLTGGAFSNWGQSTTVNTYYGLATAANAGSQITATGIAFNCNRTNSNAINGIFTTNAALNNFSGLTFQNCSTPLTLTGAAGRTTLSGSSSIGTVGTISFINSLSGGGAVEGVNSWDKPAPPALTTGWGTGPTVDVGVQDLAGKVTLGTAPASPLTLTFAGRKVNPPVCFAQNQSTNVFLGASTTVSALTITGTIAAGNVVSWACVTR
jgi:hypothetical protein